MCRLRFLLSVSVLLLRIRSPSVKNIRTQKRFDRYTHVKRMTKYGDVLGNNTEWLLRKAFRHTSEPKTWDEAKFPQIISKSWLNVRTQPCLYNTRLPEYTDTQYVHNVWESIAKTMNMEELEAEGENMWSQDFTRGLFVPETELFEIWIHSRFRN